MTVDRTLTSAEIASRRRVNPVIGTPPMPDQHPNQRSDEDEILKRVMNEGMDVDMLSVPEEMKRPGYSYMWAAKSVLGNTEMCRRRLIDLQRLGWQVVAGKRGKGFFWVEGEQEPASIEYGASILMERPTKYENIARDNQYNKAVGQLNDKLESIGHAGTKLGPVTHKISRSVEPSMEVPND